MKVVWSPLALSRVRQEVIYRSRDRPGAARAWAEGIFQTVKRLSDLPESGRILPELARPDVRELIYQGHRVIYRIGEEAILILTVRHSRQLLDLSELM